jgi:hypothetical protein
MVTINNCIVFLMIIHSIQTIELIIDKFNYDNNNNNTEIV